MKGTQGNLTKKMTRVQNNYIIDAMASFTNSLKRTEKLEKP